MTAPSLPAGSETTVDALKRVKAAETEWEAKVAEARAHRDEAFRRLRDETVAVMKAAHAEVEQERAAAVQAARAATEVEAARIVAEGDRAAAAAAREDPKLLVGKRAAILGAVLDGFAPE